MSPEIVVPECAWYDTRIGPMEGPGKSFPRVNPSVDPRKTLPELLLLTRGHIEELLSV